MNAYDEFWFVACVVSWALTLFLFYVIRKQALRIENYESSIDRAIHDLTASVDIVDMGMQNNMDVSLTGVRNVVSGVSTTLKQDIKQLREE